MFIEYITENDIYRDKLKNLDLISSDQILVSAKARRTTGKDNYILKLSTEEDNLKSAKALSEAKKKIEKLLSDEKVTFKILTNQSSQYFVKQLYPFMCEYETKLRKFINVTLFDINEAAKTTVFTQLKTAKIEINEKDVNYDFLEYSELGDIMVFLFANDSLYKDLDSYKGNAKNRFATREQLIEYIKNSNKKTIWEEFFAPNFSDSIIPQTISKIKGFRNDVMHFHNIDYEKYEEALELVKQGIKDLDKQIKKGIVLEDTEANVALLSGNTNYSMNLYNTIAAIQKLPDAIIKAYEVYEKIDFQPMINAVAALNNSANLNKTMEFISKLHTYDWSKIIKAYDAFTPPPSDESKKETRSNEQELDSSKSEENETEQQKGEDHE